MMTEATNSGRWLRIAAVTALALIWGALLLMSNPSNAALRVIDVERQGIDGVAGLAGPLALALSPNAEQVYVAGGVSNGISVFARNLFNGQLQFLKSYIDGIDGVAGLNVIGDVAVSADGAHLYAVSRFDGAIATFSRGADGQLVFIGAKRGTDFGLPGLSRAAHVVLSADGKHVYVASRNGASDGADLLAVFTRDAVSGALSFVEALTQGVNGLVGIKEINALSWGPNDAQLYATSGADNTVTVWSRDVASGKLTLQQALFDGAATGNAMAMPAGVALSRDGAFVYVAGSASDSIAVFARAADGQLSFSSAVSNGVGDVSGFDGPLALAVSAHDDALYVSAVRNNHQILVFGRNAATGALTFRERLQDMAAPDQLLQTVADVLPVATGAAFYAVGATSDTVSAWGEAAVDLALAASGPTTASVGSTVEFELKVSNVGSTRATHVVLDATWPDGVEVTAVDTGAAAVTAQAANTQQFELAALDVDASETKTFRVKTLQEGIVQATVNARAAEPDAQPADNALTLEVQVLPNNAPVAVADVVATQVNTPIDILVLFNDRDDDLGDVVSIYADMMSPVTQNDGSVTIITRDDGTQLLRYTPPAGFNGVDTFSYTVRDRVDAFSSADVTVHVNAEGVVGEAPPESGGGGGGGGGGGLWGLWWSLGLLLLVRRRNLTFNH